jgi:putative redox protein
MAVARKRPPQPRERAQPFSAACKSKQDHPLTNEATLHLESGTGLHFSAVTGSGFRIELDSVIGEGELVAPTPMELQLVALGGCTAMDVISILRKTHDDVTAYDAHLSGERAAEHPQVYTTISITHLIRGRAVHEANVRRAIELTMQRYCPVFAMLYPAVTILEHYEITEEVVDAGAPVAAPTRGTVTLTLSA